MSQLKTAILGHNPELYWPCDDAPSSTVIANAGTLGGAVNLAKVSTPNLGAYTLKSDGAESACFQSGTTGNQGWTLALPASMVFGPAQSFTMYGVVQSFSAPGSNSWVVGVGKTGTFGGVNLGVNLAGFPFWDVSAIGAGTSDDTIVPPVITDGLIHDLALVRDVPHNQLQVYLDGRLILFKTDPVSALAITDATKFINVGNWNSANNPWKGLYSDVVITKSIWSPFDIAALHNGLWAGNPPQVGTSFASSTLEALALQSAALTSMSANVAAILAAVRKTYHTP